VLVVAAYGQIMPVALLESAKFGGINIHGSLLPRWRGAAPIQRAIQHGDSKTGITIMQMDKGMDTGDILMQDEMPILSDATAEFVTHWLAELGALMIVRALDRLPDLTRTPQGGSLATYAPRIKPEEGRIDWGRTSVEIYNMYRAFTPRPGVFATAGGKRLKIIEMRPAGDGGEPGIVTSVISGGILVAAGSGSLQLIRVKPEGKPEMSGTALAIGHGIRPGSRFGL
jgi:methionyl-tRNA formyltransferase